MAVLICLAFVFRLCFTNISMFPAFGIPQANHGLSEHFKSLQKRRHLPETAPHAKEYSIIEVCEEGSGSEEDLSKVGSPSMLSVFYSSLQQFITSSKSNYPFDLIKWHIYPKRYLALSILRI